MDQDDLTCLVSNRWLHTLQVVHNNDSMTAVYGLVSVQVWMFVGVGEGGGVLI